MTTQNWSRHITFGETTLREPASLAEVQEIVAKVRAGKDQGGAGPKLQWTGQEETHF